MTAMTNGVVTPTSIKNVAQCSVSKWYNLRANTMNAEWSMSIPNPSMKNIMPNNIKFVDVRIVLFTDTHGTASLQGAGSATFTCDGHVKQITSKLAIDSTAAKRSGRRSSCLPTSSAIAMFIASPRKKAKPVAAATFPKFVDRRLVEDLFATSASTGILVWPQSPEIAEETTIQTNTWSVWRLRMPSLGAQRKSVPTEIIFPDWAMMPTTRTPMRSHNMPWRAKLARSASDEMALQVEMMSWPWTMPLVAASTPYW
mmetsp:Transcript_61995/g.202219  ORF Transcript_61995/g.202219 Transcript_61995/m.202219 type:complete len:256 (+) Transcript_61995:477-1244(+)